MKGLFGLGGHKYCTWKYESNPCWEPLGRLPVHLGLRPREASEAGPSWGASCSDTWPHDPVCLMVPDVSMVDKAVV